jgi:hypothetical protein
MTHVNLPSAVMNRGDQSELVAADIKDREFSDFIG